MKQQKVPHKSADYKKNKKEVPLTPDTSASSSSSKSQNRIVFLIIFLFSFLLYGNTLTHDYALDDAIVITQNQFTKKGIDGIKEIFTKIFKNKNRSLFIFAKINCKKPPRKILNSAWRLLFVI